MHCSFIVFGKKYWVDIFLRDLEAQKYNHTLTSPQGQQISLPIEPILRVLPFGIYEYIFPKEHMNEVLTTLGFHENSTHYLSNAKKAVIRKMIKHKKCPKIDTSKKYFWIMENIAIIPIGIKEDRDNVPIEQGQYAGYTHEQY